jgi:hypothetical protein
MNGSRSILDLSPPNIDVAAQAPSGNHFVFKNGKTNRLYTLDIRTGMPIFLVDFDSERKSLKDESLALTMPEQDLVLAVWKKGPKIVMKRIRVGGKGGDVLTEDLRDAYDRCTD